MLIRDVRSMFTDSTRFYAVNNIHDANDEVIGRERMEITNLLYGSSGFGNLEIGRESIEVVKKNVVEISVRMPDVVFAAWKKYNDDFYAKEEEEYIC